jgi:hypothetical protein
MEREKRMNFLSKVCPDCGHQFTVDDLVPPLLNFDQMFGYKYVDFYGGNVKRFTKVKCKCGQNYYLYWNKNRNGFYVKDIEPYGEVENKVKPPKEELPKVETPKIDTSKKDKPIVKADGKSLPFLTVTQFAKLNNKEMYVYLKTKFDVDVNNKMKKEVLQVLHKKCMGVVKSRNPKVALANDDTLDKTIREEKEPATDKTVASVPTS